MEINDSEEWVVIDDPGDLDDLTDEDAKFKNGDKVKFIMDYHDRWFLKYNPEYREKVYEVERYGFSIHKGSVVIKANGNPTPIFCGTNDGHERYYIPIKFVDHEEEAKKPHCNICGELITDEEIADYKRWDLDIKHAHCKDCDWKLEMAKEQRKRWYDNYADMADPGWRERQEKE